MLLLPNSKMVLSPSKSDSVLGGLISRQLVLGSIVCLTCVILFFSYLARIRQPIGIVEEVSGDSNFVFFVFHVFSRRSVSCFFI